jgi:hypothetical protein
VVLLCIAMARVLVIVYLLVGILCLWCHNVVEAASRFLGLVAEAVGGVGLAFCGRGGAGHGCGVPPLLSL